MMLGNWGLGLGGPEDKNCGLLTIWADNFQSFELTIHFLIRRECWGFGISFQRDINCWSIALGPLLLITWSGR